MDKKANYKKDSYLVDLVNQSYHYHKRVLLEAETGVKDYDYMKLRASHKIVKHIENVSNDFTGKTKLIIQSEVLGNKKGSKWYTEFFSTPSYYRARRIAYRVFLENIEK